MNDVGDLTGTKLGNYRLERLLGRGRMGIVYLARDEALLRPTALKILSWQTKEYDGQNPEAWFLAEARAVARISHPNVIQIYGVARQASLCFIAMEYISEGSVDRAVAKGGPFPPKRATEAIVQTAGALHAAHDAGIVHRDVKPENILLGADGVAKLGDFGMALQIAKPRPNDPARAGTPFYTAPEIWAGQAASPRTDIYALGATYFFMLTGRVPFEAKDLPSLIAAHRNTPVPDVTAVNPSIPAGCNRIIQKCLAKQPKDRYNTALEVVEDARALMRQLEPEATRAKYRAGAPEYMEVPDQYPLNLLEVATSQHAPAAAPVPSETKFEPSPFFRDREELAGALRWIDVPSTGCLALLGDAGSGRTTLARQFATHYAKQALTLYFDGNTLEVLGPQRTSEALPGRTSESLLHQIGNTGVKLDWMSLLLYRAAVPSLLVIDVPGKSYEHYRDACRVRLVAADGFWKLLALDSREQKAQWVSGPAFGATMPEVCELRSLTYPEAVQFVRESVNEFRKMTSVLVTPDATLLLAHLGLGSPGKIHSLLRSLGDPSSARAPRVVDSWEIWKASSNRLAPFAAAAGPSERARPMNWPTPEVLELINECRAKCGIPLRQ